MDDKKTEKITERLPLKNNEILDEKLNRVSEKLSTIENNNRMGINQIKEDINSIKCWNQVEFNKINGTVGSIEDIQHLISDKFEKQKQKIRQLLQDNKKIHLGNTRLHHELNNMKSAVNDNDIEVKRVAQYNRSSFMLEVSGIPFNKNENVSNIIQKIIMLTKITDLSIAQVDVAYRTSKRQNSPIIMLFNKKSDRTNFFKQRKKFHNLWAHQFQSSQLVDEEVSLPGFDKEQGEETGNNESLIFLNESLTPTNRRLLKEAKKASRKHNYKYKRYTVNGEVRVKKMTIMIALPYNA